jgi:AcrR family transcriptional regulator
VNNSFETEPANMNRSEQRIPKLRTRGRENRRRLLAEAERLLLETDGGPLKFSDVFEAAGVSRGSAYRIYIGIDDLLQDLSTEWINNFVDFLKAGVPEQQPESWGQLCSFLVRRGADYWANTYQTLRVLPRFQSVAHSNYNAAVREMSLCVSEIFNRYFVVPEVPGWMSKLAFFTQICDITFSDAVRAEACISEQRLIEAETLCRTYLEFYLPTWLPARPSSVS